MAQSLTEITVFQFKLLLPRMNIDSLKKTYEQIYEFKWGTQSKYFSQETIMDLERKESLILKELQTRKYLDDQSKEDYLNWWRKMNYKKRSH